MLNFETGYTSWPTDKLNSIENYYHYYKSLGIAVPDKSSIVERIAEILTSIVESNQDKECETNVFCAKSVPKITIAGYMDRIKTYSECSVETYIISLIYIDRYNHCKLNSCLNPQNCHKMIITAIMLASKLQDEKIFSNTNFGKIGGINVKEINLLEVNFVETIGFNMLVAEEMFRSYLHQILSADSNYVRDVRISSILPSRKDSNQSVQSKGDSSDGCGCSTSEKTPEEMTPQVTISHQVESGIDGVQ